MMMVFGRLKLRRAPLVVCARARYDLRRIQPAGHLLALKNLLLRHALNLPGSDWPREQVASGVMMIPVPKSGILEKIEGEDAARSVPGITALEYHRAPARLHRRVARRIQLFRFLVRQRQNLPEKWKMRFAQPTKLHFELTPRLPVEHPATGRLPGG